MLKELIASQLKNHPCCVSEDASVRDVARLMKQHDVGCVLVTRGSPGSPGKAAGIPIGIITDRDLATRCLADSLSADHAKAREVMTPNPRTISEDAGLYDCIRAMNDTGVRRIPVVDARGNALGIISFGDVLRLLSREFTTLTENCTHPSESHRTQQKTFKTA
jgi:CBS domain-containing protein